MYSLISLMMVGPVAAAAVGSSTTVSAPPQPFESHYEVLRDGKAQGEALMRLQRMDDGAWLFTVRVQATRGMAALVGFREEESSRLRWLDGQGWQVLHYQRERRAALANQREEASFDWSAGTLLLREDGEPRRLSLPPQLHDPASMVLQMAAELSSGAAPGEHAVLRRGEIQQWAFRALRTETLDQQEALVVERVRANSRRSTLSWLAPDLGYLPLRIVQIEDDGRLEMRLQAHRKLP